MKTSLTSLLILLAVSTMSAVAQVTHTNITIRVTVDHVNQGVSTNQVGQTSLFIKANDTNKDKLQSEGLSWMYASARANGETNEYSFYLARTYIKDRVKESADAKNRADSAITLEKITRLLTTDIELLSASDLNQLATISAKAP